jgi:hypothetical protein
MLVDPSTGRLSSSFLFIERLIRLLGSVCGLTIKVHHKVNTFLPRFDQGFHLLKIVMAGVEIARRSA